MLKRFNNADDSNDDEASIASSSSSASLEALPVSLRKKRVRQPSRVLVIDQRQPSTASSSLPRRRYDPLTGGYVYDAVGPDYAAAATPIAYGNRSPIQIPATATVASDAASSLGAKSVRGSVIVGSPRVSAGTFPILGGGVRAVPAGPPGTAPTLLSTATAGGFTHIDVGSGFGPIPQELCKDYYP